MSGEASDDLGMQDESRSLEKPFASTTAVVTGASSGIGRAIAIDLATGGADRLLLTYCRNESGAAETASVIRDLGCDPICCQADLANDNDVDRLADFAFENLGVIQTWVNNAGLDVLTGAAAEWDFQKKLEALMRVDLIGTTRLSRSVASRLQNQSCPSPPSITFIGWDQAPLGMEGDAGQMFGPVKAAVMAFAASMAQELAPTVRVNTVAPGWILTSWGESTSDYWDQRAKGDALMKRWGTPDDVARTVRYVADPGATFVTGQTIAVNGGWSRKTREGIG